jgi:hypothetical protein
MTTLPDRPHTALGEAEYVPALAEGAGVTLAEAHRLADRA